MDDSVKEIVDATFETIRRRGAVEPEDLKTLYFFFGSTLEKALDIYDAELVSKRVAMPSQRTFYTVEGTLAFPYVVMENWCSCPAFSKSIAKGCREMV
eukprot:jgi/Bigna1/126987/aug1.3_g1695